MTTLKAALQALGDDAAVWDEVSQTLSTASLTAAVQTLSITSLSWAAGVVGLDTTYESYRSKVHDLLDGGSTETGTIATGLRKVKTTYEGSDAAAVDRLRSAWAPTTD
ncbi:MAG: hypothetical protein IE926_01055 [Micrococcales bacterium]|uniref:hypothetical protein n=1 Tax=Phycicoccus sp. TaxID=1902410 RepID=UPI00199EB9BC|nr:hypothetical protein [Phycicoccus sp.]MBD3781534.1 hypothetical protein [Micrococcales bacterium]HMM93775.1 hypothetical protein [Phycicoccus sp.]